MEKKYEKRRAATCGMCVIEPVAMGNIRAATALLGSGAADALRDAFDDGFI